MSEAAVKALFMAPAPRTKMGLRDQFLMIFLYDTGARIQEALDVKICDLRIDKTPTVTLHGKGGKTPYLKVCGTGKGNLLRCAGTGSSPSVETYQGNALIPEWNRFDDGFPVAGTQTG